MIKLEILTNGKKIYDSFEHKNLTLEECSLVVFRLEQMKQDLINKEFEIELDITKEEDN